MCVITDLKINNVKIINEHQNLFDTIFSQKNLDDHVSTKQNKNSNLKGGLGG